jgi:hypothetical protein
MWNVVPLESVGENFVVSFSESQFQKHQASLKLLIKSGVLCHFWTRNLLKRREFTEEKLYGVGARLEHTTLKSPRPCTRPASRNRQQPKWRSSSKWFLQISSWWWIWPSFYVFADEAQPADNSMTALEGWWQSSLSCFMVRTFTWSYPIRLLFWGYIKEQSLQDELPYGRGCKGKHTKEIFCKFLRKNFFVCRECVRVQGHSFEHIL